MKFVALYILGVVACNWAFGILPMVQLGELGAWPPASLLVGLLFILRDYAQRSIGHKVMFATLIGGALSYWMASPFVAIASMASFIVSELVDQAVFSTLRRPFADRILISSAISAPIDSALFLFMIGHFSVTAAVLMTLSKMVGAFIVWNLARRIDSDVTPVTGM